MTPAPAVAARLLAAALSLVVVVAAAATLKPRAPDYVVTAIDYHFHDAHPTAPIGDGEDLVVKNQGSNVHNVTIAALSYSEDVRPGEQLVIADIADRLAPGSYQLYCHYHRDRGMTGEIVIAG